VQIETMDGGATVKIPEGTQSGREFKLRGKGFPHLNESGKGDLIVEVRVATPTRLTKAQKELMRQLGQTITVTNTPTSRSLFAKMKDIFG
jgi:molecular chaperone DnaJ